MSATAEKIKGERQEFQIELNVSQYALEQLMPLLKELKRLGSMGCSRNIKIEDYDGDSDFDFDGDGASKIFDIKVDGKEYGEE